MDSPLNTSGGGTGLIGELTAAGSRSLSFSLDAHAELHFSLPGRHPQAASITPLVDDVLVFRDDTAVQRFRVVSRSIDWGTEVQASFSCVSYRKLLDAWIFSDDTLDVKRWTAVENAEDVAWAIFNYGQTKTWGNLGATRGHVPSTPITLAAGMLDGTAASYTATDYFAAGSKRGDAIDQLSKLGSGFEWDIRPDPANPYTGMKFDVWSLAEGGRNQWGSGVASPFILDDGGNVLGGSHDTDPSEIANVGRFPVADQAYVSTSPTWVPTSKNPDPVIPGDDVYEGRWERNFSDQEFTTAAAAASAAPGLLAKARAYPPVITCDLRRGRWEGPSQLWIGDSARFVLSIPVDGQVDAYALYVDEVVRVVEAEVTVDDLGAEDVKLSLNRPAYSATRDAGAVYDRLARLERR
jgi:hypothetical protein